MINCKQCRTLLTDVLNDEVSDEGRKRLDSHLETCQACRSEFEAMEATSMEMKKRIRPEPGDQFWEGYWDRLFQRMEGEGLLKKERSRSRIRHANRVWFPSKWMIQAAVGAVLVLGGIFIGKMLFYPGPSGTGNPVITGTATKPLPNFELVHRTRDYIRRSQLMMLAIVNFNAETEDPYTLDLPYQQQVSRELVTEADWLKQELGQSKQRRLQELVTDLEMILLQIANLELDSDLATIELVKTGVNSRGVLFKINLLDPRLMQRDLDGEFPESKPVEKSRKF